MLIECFNSILRGNILLERQFWLLANRILFKHNKGVSRLLNYLAGFKDQDKARFIFNKNFKEHSYSLIKLEFKKDKEWLNASENSFLTIFDDNYPDILRQIYDPPLVLYIRGKLCPKRAGFSVVGSRSASVLGLSESKSLSAGLASRGFIIVSGMALGVDTAAHEGALSVGGNTIAVMGCGLEQIYPKRNNELARQIINQGCLISEFPIGHKILPANFPRRNRIITGLGVGTLVIEASVASGSLISANLALEQGRDVFVTKNAVQAGGFNNGVLDLYETGAVLVESAKEILIELGKKNKNPN